MPPRALHEELKRRTARPDALAAQVIKQPALLQAVFEGLEAEAARVRYGCLKVLRLVSETDPSVLYPETHRFIRLLDSDNNILKWGAILIIGNLAAVDSKGRIDCILNRYLRPINGPVLITAANVIAGFPPTKMFTRNGLSAASAAA